MMAVDSYRAMVQSEGRAGNPLPSNGDYLLALREARDSQAEVV